MTSPSSTDAGKPVVLVPACNYRQWGEHPFHSVGKKYVDAVRLAGCTPLIVPTAEPDEIGPLLALADGVLLTGSPSNVHPSHFGEDVHDPSLPLDPARDAWTLPLIRQALAIGLPLFGICRGTQETNVALGGSLHQAVQEQHGLNDHRAPEGQPPEIAYAEQHEVHVMPGGVLEGLVRTTQEHSARIAALADVQREIAHDTATKEAVSLLTRRIEQLELGASRTIGVSDAAARAAAAITRVEDSVAACLTEAQKAQKYRVPAPKRTPAPLPPQAQAAAPPANQTAAPRSPSQRVCQGSGCRNGLSDAYHARRWTLCDACFAQKKPAKKPRASSAALPTVSAATCATENVRCRPVPSGDQWRQSASSVSRRKPARAVSRCVRS